MMQEIAAGGASAGGWLTRLLTPLVNLGGRHLLRWEPRGSVLIELPNGQRLRFGRHTLANEPLLRLRNYRVITKSLRRGPLGFAEAYIDGDIKCSDLVALFEFFVLNRARLERSGRGLFKVRLRDRLAHLSRHNSKRGSRRNISEHYDLGNDFYRHWLDEDLVYSSGLYARGAETLDAAQAAKLDLIMEMLDLDAGHELLEIGIGWGALARRAARDHGARVTGVTLSHEQLAHARTATASSGLGSLCDLRLQDYRDVSGAFDRVVSIEMIEAVGEQHWDRYFSTLHDRLKPGGIAVIQSITMDEQRFEIYRQKTDFIQRYIFPGGMLPTRTAIAHYAKVAGLDLERIETFGHCYAKTLQEWRMRFEAAWPELEKLGFDERFRRKWRYYLAYCEAGFRQGIIDVGAYRLRRPGRLLKKGQCRACILRDARFARSSG